MSRSFYDKSLLGRFDQHLSEFPDQVVYRFLGDNRESESLTFGQLSARVCSIALRLRERFSPGDRAVLLYPSGLEFICAFLGCLAAGIVAVPAYPPRRNRKADRLNAIIADCAPSVLLTESSVSATFPPDLANAPVIVTDEWATIDAPRWDAELARPETIAFLQYTSGSTGTPKGVMVTHGNIARNEQQIQRSFGHHSWNKGDFVTTVVTWLPLFHDMGLIGAVLQPLYVGFPSVLMSPNTFAQEPVRWLQAVSDYRGTTTGAPNFAFDHCVRAVTDDQKRGLDLSCLRVLYNGAEPVRGDSLERFTRAFEQCGFRSRMFFPCFGMAETTLFVSGGPPDAEPKRLMVDPVALELGRIEPSAPDNVDAKCLVSCGLPAEDIDVRIVDPQTRAGVSPGCVGEIWVKSESVAAGYWNRSDDTRAAFSNWLANSGEGPFLATGDLGVIHAAELYVAGRIKDTIIIGGRNLYPQDIEAAIGRHLLFVQANACAAFGVEIDGRERLAVVVEGDRELVRVSRDQDDEQSSSRLWEIVDLACHTILADFEVSLQSLTVVRPGTFLRTSSGKVQRRATQSALNEGRLSVVFGWNASNPRELTRTATASAIAGGGD